MANLPVFAVCPRGFENILLEEIKYITNQKTCQIKRGGVFFYCDSLSIYKLNLWCRIPSRILIQLGKTQIKNSQELYEFTHKIPFERWFEVKNNIKVDVNGWGLPKDVSLRFATLKVKDAICDRFRKKVGERPNIEKNTPDIRIWINFENNLVTISIDTSGEALFKRGWRKEKGIAPIKENLASSLLYFTNWNLSQNFFDPMCGSGTFIIEAISKASGLPANFHPERERKFSCDNFLKTSPFGKIDTKNLKNEAANSWLNACKLNSLPIIIGRDIDENSINIAKKNSSYALPKHLSEFINWEIGPISSATPSVVKNENKGILVVNPPYGKRMQSNVEIEEKQINIQLGEMLKKRFLNWNAWVLSGRPNFISEIRLKPKNKIKVLNGDLECNWFEFEIFLGSRFR